MKLLAPAMLTAFAVAACQPAPTSADPAELRVALFLDGRIEANGRTVSLDELGEALDEAKNLRDAHVAYYREASDRDPPADLEPIMMTVLTTIMERRLPVRLSTKPDFSDAIDQDGQSRPYQPHGKDIQ